MSQQNLSQVDFSRFIDDYDEWICVVCQYGDSAFDGVRVLHSCGNHEFHPECLAGVSARGDVRCPVCRFPPNARPPPTQFSPAASDSSSSGFFGSADSEDMDNQPNIVWQHNPHRNRVHTVTPNLVSAMGTNVTCAWCRHAIPQIPHQRLDCDHPMHYSCVFSNMFHNGININNGSLFCPQCFNYGTHQRHFD